MAKSKSTAVAKPKSITFTATAMLSDGNWLEMIDAKIVGKSWTGCLSMPASFLPEALHKRVLAGESVPIKIKISANEKKR